QLAMAVLALASGLLDVLAVGLGGAANGFAVGDLGTPDVGIHAKLALHAVHDNFQVQFAHAGDDGLAGILVGVHAEGGIFLGEARQGLSHFVLIGLGLGFDGDVDDGRRESHGLQDDLLVFVAEGIAGGDALQSDARADIAGVHGFNFLALVGMHLQQAANAFAGALRRVVDVAAGIQHSGIDTDVGDMADKRVGHDLEG